MASYAAFIVHFANNELPMAAAPDLTHIVKQKDLVNLAIRTLKKLHKLSRRPDQKHDDLETTHHMLDILYRHHDEIVSHGVEKYDTKEQVSFHRDGLKLADICVKTIQEYSHEKACLSGLQ